MTTRDAVPSRGSQFHFPPPTTIPPISEHSITIIFLHGRGHTPDYLRESVINTLIEGRTTFRDSLPHAKFVLPSAPLMRATKYRRSLIRQWYDGTGDWEPEALGNMRHSIEHLQNLIREEISLLGGDAHKVVLAGFSQGCAMALMSFLLWEGNALGAVVGLSGFMPLNSHMMHILEDDYADACSDDGFIFGSDSNDGDFAQDEDDDRDDPLQRAIKALRCEAELPSTASASTSFKNSPVFLAHGIDDTEVDHRHGQLTADLLEKMGVPVDFHTYPGLAHEVSPTVLKDVIAFVTGSTREHDTSFV